MTSRPLRVHALIDSLSWGGAELLLGDLAIGVAAHGIELSVAHLYEADDSPSAARLRAAGVDPQLVAVGGLLDPRSVSRVRAHLVAQRPDVVHTHLQYADMLGGAAARTLGVPAVCTLHVIDPEAGARNRLRGQLAGAARRRCHERVLTVSDHVRRAYLAAGADRGTHVVTVHNGVAARAEPGVGAGVRAELGIGADELVVAIVAVLRPGKGHDVAIAAVDALRDRFPGLRLLIAGDGPARPEVAAAAARLGDAAVMAGHRGDVMALLDAADVLLHPSAADAFPTILLEALAAGVPILATAVGGIPEIVEDERSGLLVPPPPDARVLIPPLARLLGDRELRRRLAAHGRERFAAEFTAERWGERLRAVYHEVAR
jgi:glycosyltransferase involved in cell wall biosynthesis